MRRYAWPRRSLWPVVPATLPSEAERRLRRALAVWEHVGEIEACGHIVDSLAHAPGPALCVAHPRSLLRCRACADVHLHHPRAGHGVCVTCGEPADPASTLGVLGSVEARHGDARRSVGGVRLVGFDLCRGCSPALWADRVDQ